MPTITKSDFIAEVSKKTGKTKAEIKEVLGTMISTIEDEVAAGNKVKFIGFGSFEARPRAKRKGRNPATGEVMELPATIVPSFKAGNAFKDVVKK
ncbi:MAG: HU family DNA-binding protein [Bacteroides sp.]|nr:HU family DNA-binding protein [Bacteroides sp.]